MHIATYTKEFKYNWKLAAPVMLGMLGHTLVSFIDNVMVGQLGSAELAAVSLGNSFLFIAMSIGIGFSTAITPLVAEAESGQDFSRVKSVLKHGIITCTVLGIVLFLLLFSAKPLLRSMQQPEEVVNLAIPYLDLVAFSLIPLIIFQAYKQFSDGLSMTKYPMYATILANIVNVIFNYLLIYGKFGFPQMGIVGAAYGTLISRILMVLYLYLILKYHRHSKKYFEDLKLFILSKLMFKKLISQGIPNGMQMFFEVTIFTAAIWLCGFLGKNPQAANQIALNLSSMTFMVAMGLSVAAMIRVGNQKGFKNFVDLRRIAISIFLLGFIIAVVFGIMFLLFREALPKLYVNYDDVVNASDNKAVVALAAKLLIASAIFQISDSAQVIFLGALRGLQDVKIPTVITFVSYWLIGFPMCWFLGKENAFGSFGIWIGLSTGLTCAAILLFLRFNYLTKKLILKNQTI